jgi:transcriptional regulator with XRE-family HTH domain
MEERIRKFMEYKGISPSELADSIGVQRSNVTHVLKARNKPSFQFIEKLLQIYPELNAKWLLLGTGSMVESTAKNRTLFDQLTETVAPQTPKPEAKQEKPVIDEPVFAESKEKEVIVQPQPEKQNVENELHDQFFGSEKPIERLIVFFNDQTFKVYNPSR